jgi:flagellar biosynthetic protein FlhB
MAAEQDQDRNESATPYRLSEARRKGQIARSTDVVSAVVFCAAVAYLYARGMTTLEQQFRFDRLLLAQLPRVAGNDGAEPLMQLAFAMIEQGVMLLLPLLLTVMVAAIVATVAQTGGIFSFHPVQPDWSRINPVTGFKRVASLRTLFDTGRALAKLAVLVTIVYVAVRDMAPHFHQLAAATPGTFLRLLLADAAAAGVKIALGLVFIAAIDLVFTRREFDRKMRMSRREVRDESKHREGDPRIRSRLRELRREMLKRSLATRQTKHADVVVTNPTHYAVALMYRHGQMSAPRVIAKGADALAANMREIAHRHSIPVVQRPALARALYAQVEIDESLPEAFYRDVANLMIWVIAMKRARDQRAEAVA